MKESGHLFLQYVRPHWRSLNAVARRYTRDRDNARDLVQETLLRGWRHYSDNLSGNYSRGWLLAILRNVAAEWQRAARRRVTLVPMPHTELTELVPTDLTEPFAPTPSMDEKRFREFLDDHLAAALDRLEPAFREVVVLSVAGGLTYREVAQVLDCPVGTVMSRMARARRAIREQLADVARVRGWMVESRP